MTKMRMTAVVLAMAMITRAHNQSRYLVKYWPDFHIRTFVAGRLRTLATAVVLLAIFGAGLAFVQFGAAGLVGNDGYYHVKMGYLIRTQGLKPPFPYLPQTILNETAYYDHHMLYHAYLALFATVDPAVDGGLALTQGAKIASVLMPALAFLAIWWLLRGQKVPNPALWSVALLALSEPFLYRMSMARAQSVSLLLLVVGLHWLLKRRYQWLIPLGFVYVWTYNAFPLLLLVAAVYVVSLWLYEREFAWRALLFPAAGILLGLLINPYFPADIDFFFGHLAPKLGASTTRVGNEWTPYRTWTLVENSGPALIAVLLGVVALGWREKRLEKNTLVALLLTAAFGTMLFSSRRFVEYFPPFALLFLAFSIAPLWRAWQENQRRHKRALRVALPLLILLCLAYPLVNTLTGARDLVARSKAPDHYADAALWLRAHADPGAHIFQTDWDDFTRLFFYGSDETIYTAGLDPTFMEQYDPRLFEQWVAITRGRVPRPGKIIRDRFGSDFVFTDLKHDDFLDEAAVDPRLQEVYRDQYAAIFAVN
jgi:hypothetical protein